MSYFQKNFNYCYYGKKLFIYENLISVVAIQINDLYGLYELSIRMNYTDCQIRMNHTDP